LDAAVFNEEVIPITDKKTKDKKTKRQKDKKTNIKIIRPPHPPQKKQKTETDHWRETTKRKIWRTERKKKTKREFGFESETWWLVCVEGGT
jgi:hypothetical protein